MFLSSMLRRRKIFVPMRAVPNLFEQCRVQPKMREAKKNGKKGSQKVNSNQE